jgi:hypothetical protein
MSESAKCDQCGRFEAVETGYRWLCQDCIAASGACCSGDPATNDGTEYLSPDGSQNTRRQCPA